MTWVVHTPSGKIIGAWQTVQIPKYRPGDVITEQHLRDKEILKALGFRLSADGLQCRITQMMGPMAPDKPRIVVPEMVMTKPQPAPRKLPIRRIAAMQSTPGEREYLAEDYHLADFCEHGIRLAEEIVEDYAMTKLTLTPFGVGK